MSTRISVPTSPGRILVRLLLMVTAAIVLLAPWSPALAQDGDDPYGSTTTTTAAPAEATISLTVESGPRGTEVGVFACGYAPSAADGSVTFDGEVVASGLVVDADGCLTSADSVGRSATLAAHRRLRAQSGAPLTVRVPDDARPGNRNVCAVVAGYNTPCARFQVRNENAAVRGASVERDNAAAGTSQSSLPLVGSLPATGVGIGLLLAVAAVLLLGGRRLRSASARLGDRHLI